MDIYLEKGSYGEIPQNTISSYVKTRLYIKRHKITGLLYFGKTINEDVEKYKGSGKYWETHIKKYGEEHVENIWVSDWYYDPYEIQKVALDFSREHNILYHTDKNGKKVWANLKEEDGLNGGRWFHDKETLERIRTTQTSTDYLNKHTYKCKWCDESIFFKHNYDNHLLVCNHNPDHPEFEFIGIDLRSHRYIKCEFCNKSFTKSIYNRSHGEHCKHNPNRTLESITKEKNRIIKYIESHNTESYILKNSKTCEYCGGEFFIGHYKNHHGEHCKKNPNRTKESIDKSQETRKKQSEVRRTNTFLEKHTKICIYCNKEIKSPATYSQMHGENCKMNPNRPKEAIEWEISFKKAISDSKKSKKYIENHTHTCIHCGKVIVGNPVNYYRHHGDNCKQNPNYIRKETFKFVCEYCGKQFVFSKSYEKHIIKCKDKYTNEKLLNEC